AMLICCFVLVLSSTTVSGTYKGDYSDAYIYFTRLPFENNAFNLSKDFSSIDKYFKNNMKLLHANLTLYYLYYFSHLIGIYSSQDLKNYQEKYQTLIDSEKKKIKQSLEIEVDEDVSEKKHNDIEEDVSNFLQDLWSDKKLVF